MPNQKTFSKIASFYLKIWKAKSLQIFLTEFVTLAFWMLRRFRY